MLRRSLRVLLLLGLLVSWTHAAEEPARVYRDKVQPHWCADQAKFWYRVSVGRDADEFILVDAEKGLRQSAFDHAGLAEALKAAGVKEVLPEKLPLDNLEFESGGGALLFRAGQRAWRCDLKTAALKEQPQAARPIAGRTLQEAPRASRRTGEETTLTFINRSAAEVKLFWLDPDGQRQSYGILGPGQTRDQHTYAGHVWLVTDADGHRLGVFEAEDSWGEACITGEPPKRANAERTEGARLSLARRLARRPLAGLHQRPQAGCDKS